MLSTKLSSSETCERKPNQQAKRRRDEVAKTHLLVERLDLTLAALLDLLELGLELVHFAAKRSVGEGLAAFHIWRSRGGTASLGHLGHEAAKGQVS